MKNKSKPVSRLTLVFILAVVVSGSILTYFSISNIANLKELTEKRILEEERELVARFDLGIQNEIEGVTRRFQEPILPADAFIDTLTRTELQYPFITQSFLLKSDGTLLYPNFSDIPETTFKITSTEKYNAFYRKGETAEFRDSDLKLAEQNYRLALNYSRNAGDSASVLVSLARVSTKSGATETALQYYTDLITKYCRLTDSNGIPYVNFALQQLMHTKDSAKPGELINSFMECLEAMYQGEIPLSYQTRELLTQISVWEKNYAPADEPVNIRFNELINNINRQVDFVYLRRNEIIDFASRKEEDKRKPVLNQFFVVNPASGNPKDLLLLNKDSASIWGFLVNGEKLLKTILQEDFQKDMEFQYTISFPDSYTGNNQEYLTTTSLLTPFFNRQSVQIRLADQSALQKIIKKRSWIYGIASALLLLAMFLGVYLILRDIAREKRMARLQSDFVSNVTHELKTPLTSIYMFAESLLLRRVKNATTSDEYLSVILKESERLKRMINNILEFSKAEKGIPEYHFMSANLSEIVYQSIHEMDYWLEKEGFEVTAELDRSIEMRADPEKLKQAFVNLISNAVKYSNSMKSLHIQLSKNDSDVRVEFEDKGIGIPENERNRIFDKFYRVDPREGISGTGLGLTVVKEIVEAHKGKIIVESKVGKGSKFSIILNQQEAEA